MGLGFLGRERERERLGFGLVHGFGLERFRVKSGFNTFDLV
jgi:hypothetical protein